jgi:hypothetical protein
MLVHVIPAPQHFFKFLISLWHHLRPILCIHTGNIINMRKARMQGIVGITYKISTAWISLLVKLIDNVSRQVVLGKSSHSD